MADTDRQPRLYIGGVALISGRLPKFTGRILVELGQEFADVMERNWDYSTLDFASVSLIVYYGDRTDRAVEIRRVVNRYGELPVAVHGEMSRVHRSSDEHSVRAYHRDLVRCALVAIARKYKLPDCFDAASDDIT
jgi:hypothetical protein